MNPTDPLVDPVGDEAIVLIGMMGSGKSSVGDALARRLGRTLVDVDLLIEAAAGRSVAQIFADEGEASFRTWERAAILEATAVPGAVIACGGGAVLDPDNVAALRAAGMVVWLQVSPEVAALRLGSDEGRPVLRAMSGELAERLRTLIARRAEAYTAAADRVVDADGPAEVVADAVLAERL